MTDRRSQTGAAMRSGLRAVILYKTVKGALELIAALVLIMGASLGLAPHLQHLIERWQLHLTGGWSLLLAEQLADFFTRRHLALAALALTMDGLLTSIEGWALRTGRSWGPWLVICVTGLFLPFEFVELHRHVSWPRLGLLGVNLSVVAYLVWMRVHRNRGP